MGNVEVDIRSHYGQDYFYPVSVSAKLFAEIEGKKTLSAHTLDTIKQLGFNVVYTYKGMKVEGVA